MARPDRTRSTDRLFMTAALRLARRGLGRVWPNPAVGCLIVSQDGVVVGRGWTQPGGRPHAETEALRRAGPKARGATAYVTLEPCSHNGRTGPCADALIEAGIARCVAALEDPDTRVAGRGFAKLRAAGVSVEVGLEAEAARTLNAGFWLHREAKRPALTLKLATTLDGKIATTTGRSRWITGGVARAEAHALRATHDAILVGSGTALADDPMLTCRLPGLEERSPVRVVFDSALRLPLDSHLVRTARRTRCLIVTADDDPARHVPFMDHGVEVVAVERDGTGRIRLDAALGALAGFGLTRILIEGGAALASSLLQAGLVDRLVWLRAGVLFGGDGVSAVAGYGLNDPQSAPRFRLIDSRTLGPDVMEIYEPVSAHQDP